MKIKELIEVLSNIENKNANVFMKLDEINDAMVQDIDDFSKYGYIVLNYHDNELKP